MKSPIVLIESANALLLLPSLLKLPSKLFRQNFARFEGYASQYKLSTISSPTSLRSLEHKHHYFLTQLLRNLAFLNSLHRYGGPVLQCEWRVRCEPYRPKILVDHCRYIEGIVRGYRNSLLTGQNYSNLTQCETIDGNHVWRT
jgi:hypothetical protein